MNKHFEAVFRWRGKTGEKFKTEANCVKLNETSSKRRKLEGNNCESWLW